MLTPRSGRRIGFRRRYEMNAETRFDLVSGDSAVERPMFLPLLGRNDAVGLRANAASPKCYPCEAVLAAVLTNSRSGEYAWRLPTLLPLLGVRASFSPTESFRQVGK